MEGMDAVHSILHHCGMCNRLTDDVAERRSKRETATRQEANTGNQVAIEADKVAVGGARCPSITSHPSVQTPVNSFLSQPMFGGGRESRLDCSVCLLQKTLIALHCSL